MSPSIVHYAMGNARVSGIQRVQLNLIGHLVRRLGGNVVRCMFEHPHLKEMLEFNPTTLFESDEFDAGLLLRRLGLSGTSRIFPSKASMRKYLRQYSGNKLKRTAVKTDILVSALLFPGRLAAMGLRRPSAAELAVVPVSLQPIDRLPVQARLVFLGATWSLPRTTAFGREHAAQGGIVVQLIYDLDPTSSPRVLLTQLG